MGGAGGKVACLQATGSPRFQAAELPGFFWLLFLTKKVTLTLYTVLGYTR